VISGVVALGLLGFGGWYLYSAIEKNNQIDGEINQIKAEIERLLNMDPTPNQQNLTLAKQEAAKLTAFITEARKQFPPAPPAAEPLNDLSFRSLLENTVNDLHKQAKSVGIQAEDTNRYYYFTFEAQREAMRFSPESLRPLSERLSEVRQIAEILFKARVNRLAWMKRAMVPGERPQQPGGNVAAGGNLTADYFANVSARTNAEAGMVLWPYEVVFDCFSPELGVVLEAFERTPGFIVKSVATAVSPEALAAAGPRRPDPPGAQPRNPGLRPVPGARPNAPAPVAALTTVINERPLRVTLRIEVIKPEPPQPGTGGPAGGRPTGGRRGTP
jgi:hypothetical protein